MFVIAGLWTGRAALAGAVSVDVDRAVTVYDEEGPVDVTTPEGETWRFRGPNEAPALWTTVRVGHELGTPLVRLTPEIAVGTAVLGTSWYERASSYEIRAVGGVRVGLGGPVRPGVYGHIGWGWGLYEHVGAGARAAGGRLEQENAVTLDAGGSLDLAFGKLRLGGHGGYMLFPTWWGNARTWVAGGHAGIAW